MRYQTLHEQKQMDNVQGTGDMGTPGPAKNTESVEAELPATVVTR